MLTSLTSFKTKKLSEKRNIQWAILILGIVILASKTFSVHTNLQMALKSAVKMNNNFPKSPSALIISVFQSKEKNRYFSEKVADFLKEYNYSEKVIVDSYIYQYNLYFKYLDELLWTIGLIFLPTILMCTLAYLLAYWADETESLVWRYPARIFLEAINYLPYILWSLLFIFIATRLWRMRVVPYEVYYMIIYLGFAMFLIFFFVRQNRRRILSLRRKGFLQSERMMGFGSIKRCYYLFRLQFIKTTFARQLIFATVFVMLMEFSFSYIRPFQHSGYQHTVFSSGRYYYSEKQLSSANNGFQDFLLKIVEQIPKGTNTYIQTISLLEKPSAIMLQVERDTLQEKLDKDLIYANENKPQLYDQLMRIKSELFEIPFTHQEFEKLFYEQISDFYIQVNRCLVFALFFFGFFIFDMKEVIKDG